jgi:hypothetical protein
MARRARDGLADRAFAKHERLLLLEPVTQGRPFGGSLLLAKAETQGERRIW